MLDDLRPIHRPVCKTVARKKEEIAKFVMGIANKYKPCFPEDGVRNKYDKLGCVIQDDEYKARKKRRDEWDAKYSKSKSDPSNFFSGYVLEYQEDPPFDEKNADDVAETLLEDGYFVRNRVEKYYVIAFSLDFTTFSVYSKDCDPRPIDWKEVPEDDSDGDEPEVREKIEVRNGDFKGPLLNEDDNVNPVIAAVKNALGES